MIITPFAFMAPSGFDSDYQAILDYATTQGYTLPSAGQQTLQNQLVLDMKSAGAWSGLSIFYVMATDGDRDFAKINWADPGNFELTEVNAPTFTTDVGFTGNGTNQALDTGFVPSTDWGTSLDVSMGGWADLNNNTGTIIGSFLSERTHLIHKWTSGDTFIALGGDGGTLGVLTQTSGLWVLDNDGVGIGTNRLYVNESLIGSNPLTPGFLGWSTVSLGIIARKRSNTPTFDGWGSSDYKMAFYGNRNVGQNIYTPFNDYISALLPPALVAYSMRKLYNAYAGSALQVRRSGDNTTQDIGFDANGDLDTAAMEAFVVAGGGTQDGFVTTWYDQSGNGDDQAQATAANQPKIVSSGTTITQGGKPAMEFDGSNDFMSRANIISTTADKTTFNVYYPTSVAVSDCIMELSSVSPAVGQFWTLTSETALRCNSRTYVTTAGVSNTYSLLEMWQDGITINNAAQFKMYLNGTYEARTSGASGDLVTATGDFYIGYSPNNGNNPFNGTQQEVLIFDSALTDLTREIVRDNINAYYSVY